MKQDSNLKKRAVLLGIESSGVTCGVGISLGGRLEKEISVEGKNVHSEKLAVFTESILADLKMEISDLSGIVLSAGPGSFTGLRIGYSLAKGIAHFSKIPLIEVPTLDVWAYQLGKQDSQIMALIDAYRNEVFYSIYKWKDNQFAQIADYSLINIGNLAELITKPTLITGVIPAELESEIKGISQPLVSPNGPTQLSMHSLLELGYQKSEKAEFSDLNSCEPFYMRKFKGVS